MVQKVYMRLKGERGASLSFALLLMLVCTMVTAVVLAASTASAGQFANRASMDQRYYSVTSAGELLRSTVLEHEVTVTVTTKEIDGVINRGEPEYSDQDKISAPAVLKALTDMLFKENGPIDMFDEVGTDGDAFFQSKFFRIEPADMGSLAGKTGLDVKVDCIMKLSGVVQLDLYNVDSSGLNGLKDSETYHLGMVFSPDIQQTWSETNTDGHEESEYTVTWRLLEVAPGRDVVQL